MWFGYLGDSWLTEQIWHFFFCFCFVEYRTLGFTVLWKSSRIPVLNHLSLFFVCLFVCFGFVCFVLLCLRGIVFVFYWMTLTASISLELWDYFDCLHLLGVFESFFSRAFRCVFKLLVWDIYNFIMNALSAVNFPLSTVFIVSHKLRYIVPLFLFLSWPSYQWVESCSVFMGF